MRGIVFVVAVVLGLIIFGLPILANFMALLVIFLGVGVEAALSVGIVLTVGMVIWIAIKVLLGGVIGGAFLGIYPGLDFEMLPLAFAVVIIGGMGSLGGAAIGALAVGLADNFGKALFPEISYFTLYAPMVLILAVKPTGLFGRE